jgi:DNA-binding response OmpR family regulator
MPKKMRESKKTVLLIEDDTFLSGMYVTKLSLEGFDVQIAADGEAGVREAKAILPDIVLLDILLPKKDGFAVLKEIKEDSKVKHIPVVLLTNLGQKDDVDRGLSLGAADYLIKAHFMPSEVVEKVKKILSK